LKALREAKLENLMDGIVEVKRTKADLIWKKARIFAAQSSAYHHAA
jgi:hypothetical protein